MSWASDSSNFFFIIIIIVIFHTVCIVRSQEAEFQNMQCVLKCLNIPPAYCPSLPNMYYMRCFWCVITHMSIASTFFLPSASGNNNNSTCIVPFARALLPIITVSGKSSQSFFASPKGATGQVHTLTTHQHLDCNIWLSILPKDTNMMTVAGLKVIFQVLFIHHVWIGVVNMHLFCIQLNL